MNITQLKYFNALENSKSYTKAAENSFISQPALSIAIRKLESELGVQLFEKSGSSVVLTKAGEQLSPLINHILADIECIYSEAAYSISDKGYRVILGVPQVVDAYLLNEIKFQFSHIDSSADVEIVQYNSSTAENLLLNGKLDLCILQSPVASENISYTDLTTQELCVYVSPSNPLYAKTCVTPAELSQQTIMASIDDSGLPQCIIDYQKRNGELVPKFSGDVLNKWTAIHMLGSKDVAIFPKTTKPHDFCKQLPMDPPLYQNLVLAWNDTIPHTSVQTKLYNIIKNLKKMM
jgi:DNA-binding transcriptional LysR family regulator